jgi:hypothetical protein
MIFIPHRVDPAATVGIMPMWLRGSITAIWNPECFTLGRDPIMGRRGRRSSARSSHESSAGWVFRVEGRDHGRRPLLSPSGYSGQEATPWFWSAQHDTLILSEALSSFQSPACPSPVRGNDCCGQPLARRAGGHRLGSPGRRFRRTHLLSINKEGAL